MAPTSRTYYKLNINGFSVRNLSPAGGGIVLLDFCGKIEVAKALFFGLGISMFAELQALSLGLHPCQQLGYGEV